ncbi:ATP/cobalamin adenosyltransferase [Denitrovibrio acetiphilus DSM 12809]|uniref:Corrinoid adenosyltransferase n=1 Tax=Denitrovibrio acetiphilus (strain DSM 12809 / NBRC 114555 / N2460) TaxID=522772 RepID=D4H7C7_DENA2|nr:cob(I)yrinic acid a,c-diamide adenosyltransferase [Denitrovibrio acetiphilus]ADD67926.1 ATP/cobalamin adenosyltransferase [Denitrovibrio acetiphilus DSM 12809]
MSVTTKGGDKGKTSLYSGQRVSKDDIRIETVGTGDELVSNLGELKFFVPDYKGTIDRVQKNLFVVNAHCADMDGGRYDVAEEETDFLESFIKEGEKRLDLKGFILPSENRSAAKADVCRTVCRRFERRLISLSACANVSPAVLKYINRLSDFLYIMARLVGKEND